MTGREKIAAAFSPGGTPEFGAVICYEGIYYRDHYAEFTDHPWWVFHSGDVALHLSAWEERLRRTGQDWLALPMGPSREEQQHVRVEVRADGVFRVDRRTGRGQLLHPPLIAGYCVAGGDAERPSPRSLAQVDELLPPPETSAVPPAYPDDGSLDLTRALLAGPARTLFPIGHLSTPLWACSGLYSFTGLMTAVVECPEVVAHACQRVVNRIMPGIGWLKHLGVQAVWLEECWTDMVSPAAYAELQLPALRRLTAALRAAGLYSIHYYCGDPNDRLDLLLTTGADALSLEESKKHFTIDIAKVAEVVDGRMTLLGNLDAIGLLPHGTDDELRAEISRQLAAGRRNHQRFIMSIGSPVTPGTSVARVRRYCDLVHELGS